MRHPVKVKLGFKNSYLYSALNPLSGEHHTLLLPYVNTGCMNIYLEYLGKSLAGKKALLIMDGAGWHKSLGLKVPPGVKIVYLPSYCPELNPVEGLWKYIKNHTIRNRIFVTLGAVEDAVCDFVKNNITKDRIKSISDGYNYLIT